MTKAQRLTLLATIMGSGIVVLDSTIVNLALPKIASQLHAGFTDLQWVVDGYMLSLSALILLGGSLGDIFGRKRAYMIGLLGFGASSLLCALAPNIDSLIILRVMQGIFGALLVPGGLAIINTNFGSGQRGAAIGLWSAWLAIFGPVGPLLGGYLLGVGSWRLIFLVNVPLVIVCAVLAQIGVRDSRDSQPRRIDTVGALLAMASLAALTFGLIEGPADHWRLVSDALLATGALLGATFIYQEHHSHDPMVPLGLFRTRNFSAANIMTFALYGGLAGFTFSLVIHLQTVLGDSAIKAGASILPLPIAMFLLSRRFGALSAKLGPRLFMTVGSLFVGAGMVSMYWLRHGNGYVAHVLPGTLLFGFGMSLLVAPLTITVMSSVGDANSGIASGINNAVSRVAGLLVIAVLGLFGAAQAYHFAIILCGSLAITAGVLSFILVQKLPKASLPSA
jgi:EmrB/QacA subfamily drug resistance transporter